MTSTTVFTRSWATVVSTAGPDTDVLRMSPDHGTATLPLITRTGFEHLHIVTSQIGSM